MTLIEPKEKKEKKRKHLSICSVYVCTYIYCMCKTKKWIRIHFCKGRLGWLQFLIHVLLGYYFRRDPSFLPCDEVGQAFQKIKTPLSWTQLLMTQSLQFSWQCCRNGFIDILFFKKKNSQSILQMWNSLVGFYPGSKIMYSLIKTWHWREGSWHTSVKITNSFPWVASV